MSDPVIPPEPGHGARLSYERLKAARLRRGDQEPGAYEKAFGKGADGERLVGHALNIAAGAVGNVAVLHDLTRGRRCGNIDHVVIGPAGVTIVDAKKWDAPAAINDRGLWLGRYPCRKHFDGLARQRERVRSMLLEAGRGDVPLESILCLVHGARGLDGEVRWVDGQGVGKIDPVASRVIRPGPLSEAVVAEIVHLLRGRFEVGAEGFQPSLPLPSVVTPPIAPRRKPRLSVRPFRLAVAGVLSVLLVATVVAIVAVFVQSVDEAVDSLRPMTRADLRSELPNAHKLARQRARHPVTRVRIRETSDAFVVSYRSRRRCRVTVTYRRQFAPPPSVASRNCG